MITTDSIRQQLATVKYPGFSRDIVSFGLVKDIRITGTEVVVQMSMSTADAAIPRQIKEQSEAALSAIPGVTSVAVRIDITAPQQQPMGAQSMPQTSIPGVKHVIAVASGKGGVGKSTVAANLACALAATGASVGLCECDLYGPSVGIMFGANERPFADEDNRIIPIERYGLKLMSMGFLLEDDSPAILRGPMVTKYTQQFLRQVNWDGTDFLVLDLPPGTGDIQLTIVQTVALSGAVIVTTPQEVALIDARKAVAMFGKTNVPILGIVENMSYFLCPGDGKRYDIFGTGGGGREAAKLQVPLLGEVPIEPLVRQSGDSGRPAVEAHPESAAAEVFRGIAEKIQRAVA